jgi:hypothetical protein
VAHFSLFWPSFEIQRSDVGKRERAQQQRGYGAEDGGTGADADAGDEGGKGDESGIAPHSTKCLAQILREIAHPADDPYGAGFF